MFKAENLLVARNELGHELKCDGLGDFGKFLTHFKACMARHGHGCVLNKDSTGPPVKPRDALSAVRNGTAHSSDRREIADYNKSNDIFKQHCEVVFASVKHTLGETVRSYLDVSMDSMDDSSYRNITRLLRKLEAKYDTWSDNKGKRNYYAMLAVPKFTSIASVFSGLKSLQILIKERDRWPGQGYNDDFYRQWLLDHMDSWDLLKFQFNTLESQPTINFQTAQKTLIDYMALQQEKADVKKSQDLEMSKAQSSKTVSGFTYTDNAVAISSEDYEALRADLPGMRVRSFNGVCYQCNQTGHMARDCPVLQQPPQDGGPGLRGQHRPQQGAFRPQTPQVPRSYYRQVPNPEYHQMTRSMVHPTQTAMMQPTALQLQLFQAWMQKEAEVQHAVPRKGSWPPTGTGPSRPIATVGVHDEENFDATVSDYSVDQDYMEATGGIDPFLYELIDPAAESADHGADLK